MYYTAFFFKCEGDGVDGELLKLFFFRKSVLRLFVYFRWMYGVRICLFTRSRWSWTWSVLGFGGYLFFV